MIAIDTNILVYAHRDDFRDEHAPAWNALADLINGTRSWTVPWPCVHEFLANVTNPRVFLEPTSLDMALEAAQVWFRSSRFVPVAESIHHMETLVRISRHGKIKGAMFHDAKVAAICIDHGITEFWTADRDFSRFPDLHIRNPLVG